MTGFEVYKTYLAIKLHFTKDDYNYFTFNGKSRASESSFEKRKDRYFFKKLATKFDKDTILQFFVSHFVENSSTWIGDLSVYNSSTYNAWKKKIQSMTFMFENDIDYLIDLFTNTNSKLIAEVDKSITFIDFTKNKSKNHLGNTTINFKNEKELIDQDHIPNWLV